MPLPELPFWTGDEDAPVDLILTEEEVPETLPDPVWNGPLQVVGRDGSVLLHIRNLVRILSRCDGRLSLQRLDTSDDEDWKLFLLGSVISYLCHQRGLLPLHAACLRKEAGSVAILGPSGRGKSTLAFQMVQRGARLLSDDMTPVRVGPSGPQVIPAFPRMKLWGQTLSALGIANDGFARVRRNVDKFDLSPRADAFDPSPLPLMAAVILTDGPEVELERLPATVALATLSSLVHRPRIADHLGVRPRIFAELSVIANAVPVYRLRRPKTFESLDSSAAMLETVLR